jgi:hypothetical protein
MLISFRGVPQTLQIVYSARETLHHGVGYQLRIAPIMDNPPTQGLKL